MKTTKKTTPPAVVSTQVGRAPSSFRITRQDIQVEKNKPLPPDVEEASSKAIYPLAELKVGQSFSFPYASKLKARMLNSVNSCIRNYSAKRAASRFLARIIEAEGVIRVWRLKDHKKS